MFAIFSSDGTSLTIPLPAVIVNGVHVDPDNWPITNDPAIVLSSHPSAAKTVTKRSDGNFEVTWTGLSPALTHGQIVRITIDGEIDSVAWSTVEFYFQVLHYPPKLSAYTDARGGYLDKLNVTGVLANSDAAETYKADLTDVLSAIEAIGGGSGSGDWTENEKTAIKSILGVPASGATPATPTTGVLASIKSKTDQLTQNTSVSIVNPFNRQTRTLTLVQRCDFTADSVGGPVRIPLEETNLADGDTIRFGAWRGVEYIEADGTIEETDDGFDAVIPLTATDLDVEAGADWKYDVKHIDDTITSALLANQVLVIVESSEDPA